MRKLQLLFATLSSFAVSSYVMAAPDPVAYEGDYEKKAGLPQLDPTFYASQLFWLAITFILLYVIYSRNVLPTISGILENRYQLIQDDLDSAESLKKEAEEVQQAYETKLEEAREKVASLYAEIDRDIAEKSEERLKEFQEDFSKEVSLAEAKLANAKKEAMKDMDTIAAEIASIATKKIVGVKMDPDQAQDIVKDLSKKKAA